MTPQFWMVIGIGCGSPTHRHPNLNEARSEAKRLARLHPDIEFIVLEAVECFVKRDVATFNYRSGVSFDDGIPF